jgi:hypothetical protein
MVVFEGFGGVSRERVSAFEREYRLRLPQDYREFLVTYNGGYPDLTQFTIAEAGTDALVHYFIGLGTAQARDLVFWLERYREEVPAHFLIIGRDPGGNLLVLGCEGATDPGVYYWDHAHALTGSSDERNTYYLAPSFSEFIDALRIG